MLEKAIAVFLAIFLTTAVAAAQNSGSGQMISADYWAWQNPLPQGNDLKGVWGSSSSDVYAVGNLGTILHYNGNAWTGVLIGTDDLFGVWGSPSRDSNGNANDIYAVGEDGAILHYNGSAWASLTSSSPSTFYGVWGSSATDVYVVGAGGTILHFNGTAWIPLSSGTTNDIQAIWGSSTTDVYAVGSAGTILHFDGTAWSPQNSGTTMNLHSVWGSSSTDTSGHANDVYVASDLIQLVQNDENYFSASLHYDGTGWSLVTPTPYTASNFSNFYAIWGSSSSDILAAGDSVVGVYNGTYWTMNSEPLNPVPAFPYFQILGIWGSSSTDVYAVGASGLIGHWNGTTWTAVSSSIFNLWVEENPLYSVWGSSATDVYAVGDAGIWYSPAYSHYDGSGWSGETQAYNLFYGIFDGDGYGYSINGVWGSSATSIFLAGDNGVTAFYNGIDFTGLSTSIPNALKSIAGIQTPSLLDVYVVGTGGNILEGNSAGWNIIDTESVDLYGVWVGSSTGSNGTANDIYVAGSGGSILPFDGNTWNSMISGSTNDIKGIWGSSSTDVNGYANDLYAVGLGGVILHYDGNSGLNWTSLSSSTTNDLFAIWGSSSTNIYAVGASGTILNFNGTAWTARSSGTLETLFGVWGSSATDVFVVGDSGTILHYQPPTAPRNPVPTTTTISPTTVAYGSGSFTMTVTGTNFLSGSLVLFNGSGVATTFVSATQLTALIPSTALTSGGTFNVTVFDPAPGGGTSNVQNFIVSQLSTTLSIANTFGIAGGTVSLSATLSSGGSEISGKAITFTLNGAVVGTANTTFSGIAALSGVPLSGINVGSISIAASFAGDANYASSNASGTVTLSQGSTSLSVAPASGTYGGSASLSATLTSSGGFGINGELIAFSLNGTEVGTATTNGSGIATLSAASLSGMNAGTATIGASFAPDANYTGSSSSSTLVVNAAPTAVTTADVQVLALPVAQVVTLSATVTSPAGIVNTGSVTFAICCLYDFDIGTPVTVPVINGSATASYTLPLPMLLVGTYGISASYNGPPNFIYSSDNSHHLVATQAVSDLAITSFTIPPGSQTIDPQSLTIAVQVCNLSGQPAGDVIVYVGQTDLTYGTYQGAFALYYGSLLVGGCSTQTATIVWSIAAKGLLTTTVSSDSFDSNAANNTSTLEVDGFYFDSTIAPYTLLNDYTFRVDRDAYSFPNQGSNVGWDLFEDTFGANNVDKPIISFLGIDIGTEDDPIAEMFYGELWQPWFLSGNCFGMAAGSLQHWNAGSLAGIYSVPTPSRDPGNGGYLQNDPTWRPIEILNGTALGYQVLNLLASHWVDDPKTTLNSLEAQMGGPGTVNNSWPNSGPSTSDPYMLVLLNQNSLQGHAVVPYRIIFTQNNADIYVYDSNYPYYASTSSSSGGGSGSSGSGSSSGPGPYPNYVVHVDLVNNTWSYSTPATPSWGGSWGMYVVPRSLYGSQPTLPYEQNLNIVTVTPSGHVLNTDSTGKALGYVYLTNGIKAYAAISGAMQMMSTSSSSPDSPFPEAYVLPAGQYLTTLSGNSTGSATATLFESNAALAFTSSGTTPTNQDTVIFSQDGNTVTLGTNAASEQYSTTLFSQLGTAVREYTVGNTTMANGETITQAVINGGASFEIVNQGNAKTYDLTLQQLGAGQGQTFFTGLSIGAGETQTFTPSDWTNLGAAPVNLQVQNSQGTSSGTLQAAAITSANSASFTYGTGGAFTVMTTGFPKPVLSETGALPSGTTFNPATGVLSVPPTSGPMGNYNITFMAKNAVGTAPIQTFTLTVNPASLTVTASNATRQYGQANPTFSGTITGLVNGDNITGTYSTTATPTSTVGSYAITPTLLDPGSKLPNYSVTVNNGRLTVSQATPVIAWTPASIQLGYLLGAVQLDATANVPGTFTYTPSSGTAIMTTSQTLSVLFTPTDWTDYTTANMSVPLTVTPGPLASVSPSSINFGTLYLGAVVARNVTVTNVGNAPMTITDTLFSILHGGDSNEYGAVNLCPKSLAAGKSCTIAVGFVAGPFYTPQTAVLNVKDNAAGSPQTVALSATVINPHATVSASSLSFGKQKVNINSVAKAVTLKNTGATALTITGVAIAGTNSQDFTQTNNCPGSLAVNAICTMDVTFTPTAVGSRSGSVVITDNAQNSPQTISLSGAGN
jgi:hypothetical protein